MNSLAPPRPSGRRRAIAFAASIASIALAVTGCSSGEDPAPPPGSEGDIKQGGIISIGLSADPGNLDPTMANTLTSVSVFNSMCELLYNVNHDGVVFPQLAAAAPEFNDDGTVVTIPLREGVLFADGTPMDADAVKFSLDRHLTKEGSQRTNELASVESVEVVDELTVQLNLKQPLAPGAFDVVLTDRAGTIVSPTAVETLGDDGFAQTPVCVGPFKFESRVPQDNVTLVKDEGYYDAENVHLDGVVYRIIPDTAVRATNLRSGDLHAMERVATTDLDQLEAESDIEVVRFAGLGFLNLIFNIGNVNGATGEPGELDTPLAQDPRIRLALAKSINREALNTAVYGGAYEEACSFMAPSSALYSDQTSSCIEYDPDGARQLLEDAGVDLPFRIEYLATNIPEYRRIGEVIQQMAGEVGFEIVLDMNESTATVDLSYAGNFEMYLNSWSGRIDPDANISQFASSTSPRSVSKYSNARVDQLIVEARSAQSVDDRIAAYDEIDRILKEDVPMIFLVRPVNLIGHSTEVAGLTFRPNGGIVPTYAGFLE